MPRGSVIVPFGRQAEALRYRDPVRTATRALRVSIQSPSWGDVEVRTWYTRTAMARAIRRDESRAPSSDWSPVMPLGETEGYQP